MLKYFFVLTLTCFFLACSGASSQFVNVSLPNFRFENTTQKSTQNQGLKARVSNLVIEQNNNYSNNFENSVLKIRLDKEIELLKARLEEELKNALKLKGYELDEENPTHELSGTIFIYINEDNVEQDSNWLKGEYIHSNLSLSMQARLNFADNANNIVKIDSNSALDSSVSIIYPIKNNKGLSMFRSTLSSVPTQLNKGLERAAFELDKVFLNFYKNTLEASYDNIALASFEGTQETKQEIFNDFEPRY